MIDDSDTGNEIANIDAQPFDWLGLARNAYSSSTPFVDSFLRPRWDKNLRQWQGKHATESKYCNKDYGKTNLFRPRTRAVIRKNEAAAAQAYLATEDVVSVTPENDENAIDRLTAEITHSLLNQRLKKSIPWFQTVVGAFQAAQIYGEVISYQYWDKIKDKPCIDLVPPENFRIDPASDWIDPIGSTPYIIHLLPMYVFEVREYEGWAQVDDRSLLAASKENYDSTRITRENTNDTKANHDANVTDYTIVWVRRYICKKDGVDWLFYTLGNEFLLSEPVTLDQAYLQKERPYVKGCCVIETFKPNPSGIPELVRDIQKEINEVANQRMDNVKFAMNKRYFARRGTQVDLRSLTRNIPGSVTLMNDPEKDVIVHSTPDVTGSSFQEQDRLNLDFDDLSGTFSGSSVQANRKLNETVGGMNMLSQSSNQIAEYQLKTFNETWAEPVLRQIAKLELLYETNEELLATASKQSETFRELRLKYFTDVMFSGKFTLNVNVGTGASNPQTQVERFFYGLQTLAAISPELVQKLDEEEVIKEAFGKLGYKDGKRFFELGDDPKVQQLLMQIQQMQQELMNKRNPAIDAATVEKLKAETTAKRVEGIYSAISAAKEVAIIPNIAPISDSIYKSAGGEDMDGFPISVVPTEPIEAVVQHNTSPMFPPHAATGINSGIESMDS
jgi:hypothetical protein